VSLVLAMIDRGTLLLNYRGLKDTPREKLRIGIVLEGPRGPLWIRSLIELLGSIPSFDVHLFVADSETPRAPATSAGLAGRLYKWSRSKADPFGEVDLDLGEAPLPDSMREAIRARKLDLLYWIPEETIPQGSCSDLARFGVITIQLGEASTKPPYWQEVIDRQLLSHATILWHATSFERARVLRTAEVATKPGWFFTRNAEECLVAVCHMIAAVGLELLSEGQSWVARRLAIPEDNGRVPCRRKYPSNVASARFIAGQARRSLSLRAKVRGRHERWFVAIRKNSARNYANSGMFSPSAL